MCEFEVRAPRIQRPRIAPRLEISFGLLCSERCSTAFSKSADGSRDRTRNSIPKDDRRHARADRDRADVHIAEIDVPADLALRIRSAGEFGHALLKRAAVVDDKPLQIAANSRQLIDMLYLKMPRDREGRKRDDAGGAGCVRRGRSETLPHAPSVLLKISWRKVTRVSFVEFGEDIFHLMRKCRQCG
jgi:hypothetical protein